jgi:very-short-patch-repair endonuclease
MLDLAPQDIVRRKKGKNTDLPLANREFEVRDDEGRLITVPDFTWEDAKLAVYCDGFAFHGDRDTLELDARKRNFLQARGWAVLTFWGRTILRNPDACATEITDLYRQRSSGEGRSGIGAETTRHGDS